MRVDNVKKFKRERILVGFFLSLCVGLSSSTTINQECDQRDVEAQKERIQQAKIELWKRGAFALDENALFPRNELSSNNNESCELAAVADEMEHMVDLAPIRIGPIMEVRRDFQSTVGKANNYDFGIGGVRNAMMQMRGGGGSSSSVQGNAKPKLKELAERFGSEFTEAIKKNVKEHQEDCEISCEAFYCANTGTSNKSSKWNDTSFLSYSMGPVPPEDFADEFGFPLDLIKVSNQAIFPPSEAAEVVLIAEEEGLSQNEFPSGKYKLGGDWLVNLPRTRAWFNERLESTFFPLLANLFPEIISSPSVLRAHSVSLLKYNSSHPRTDVHIDNGVLAMTVAMTPKNEYNGGGTFFEHMGVEHVLPMDVGEGTFRPGSVRHGGHRVASGTRYILGAFLLIEDRVEHVRRLKNRGSELRRKGDLEGAVKHFKWALAINPKCTTCLKDWVEILHFQKHFSQAENKIREVLRLLEDQDSDALFTLGVLLSEQGKDDESIEAYQKSVRLNAEDAELCYNLGTKLGARGDTKGEQEMYAKATAVDPKMGGAWINWGTSLAEKRDLQAAEDKFKRALMCGDEMAPKAMFNLALVYQANANKLAASGDLVSAKTAITEASKMLDTAKPLLSIQNNSNDEDLVRYRSQLGPLRMQVHKLSGQIFAGMKDLPGCEAEFRTCATNFPDEPMAWGMLSRILEVQGKTEEANAAKAKMGSVAVQKGINK